MNEEKDRFGDFISLLERAREDVYFAEKDRELLDRQKRRLETSQAMTCPQCGIALHNSSLTNFMVRRCSKCGGIWVDHTVVQQFINMKKIEPEAAYRWSKLSLRYVWPSERR